MRFLIDAQLPPGLCSWFNDQGYSAQHVTETLGGQTPDRLIAEHAINGDRILVTKDDDFRFRFPPTAYRLVWLRCGKITNVGLRHWLDARWHEVAARLSAGDRLIEVR